MPDRRERTGQVKARFAPQLQPTATLRVPHATDQLGVTDTLPSPPSRRPAAKALAGDDGAVRVVPRPGSIAAQARQGAVGAARPNRADRAASRFPTIHDVIDARAIFPVFQPLVRADDRALVGYEALSRGPASTPWESADALFAAATEVGRLTELDWACRARIGRAAIAAGLDRSTALFVNAEPLAAATPCPDDLLPAIRDAERRLHLVVEMTERSIAADPAGLLTAASTLRAAGCSIALDDVGAIPASLALMPLLDPDVIKLDMHLLRHPHDLATARVVNSVIAQAERSGAAILAEGVETSAHLATARTMGASYVQGWLTGRPGPLPTDAAPSLPPERLYRRVAAEPTGTPFELLSAARPARRASKDSLLAISQYLETKGLDSEEPPVVLACFQHDRYLTATTRQRYARLATSAGLVAALGEDVGPEPAPGVRGAVLGADDALRNEWNVVVVGPHFSGALVARDLGDDGPDSERRFDYVLTYERSLVLQAARALLRWLAPVSPDHYR
ncbi:sensor domain-containing phosphodiesterase [Cryptosporangium aurantiacum]|uniref:EAL domain, c-di-GMP-specific phosphodiesterase class I (Or its enzymatically inactive variant) n=1 Tax=Cryptosporangium aurantiacum TaxID=134849 RepID=A0A1M7RDX4_9ACTN|nr:EAL domain-containing protein [Cryptosporangium aurantiacum]SHN44517.1 EAL domain, c-di-GMP-specific phosphodiesterase class I (or its enzymatically inactive variant) [Cryptosporangium aurantiacum]